MKPKMDEKQTRALECLDELTAYALENKIPMRIMDELEECKKQITFPNVDWTSVSLTMEDLLNSIEQKMPPQTVRKAHNDNEVSAEMVKEQIEKMAGRCRTDNMTSIDGMTERKNTIVKMNRDQLMDITRTKAHLDEFKDESLYLQFFQRCVTRYEKDCFEMFREFLTSVRGNYDHMLDHMKSMFQNIGGYKNGIGNEKFYYEYEERRTGIDQRVQNELQTADIGNGDIMSFYERTRDTVKTVVKKLTRKRKLFAWLPVFILLVVIAACAVSVQTESPENTDQIESSENDQDPQLKEKAIDTGKSAIKKASPNTIGTVLSSAFTLLISLIVSFGAFLIFIILLVVLLYVLYLKTLKKWCDRQICKQCGEYLKTELSQFEQTNELSSKLDAAMENAAEEYARQYMDVLNNLFRDSHYRTENTVQTGTISEFDSLRAEWDHVRSM